MEETKMSIHTNWIELKQWMQHEKIREAIRKLSQGNIN
jgi:hypothetical protein